MSEPLGTQVAQALTATRELMEYPLLQQVAKYRLCIIHKVLTRVSGMFPVEPAKPYHTGTKAQVYRNFKATE